MEDIYFTTITSLRDRIRRGDIKAREVIEKYLGRAQKLNQRLNAFISLNQEGALAQADKIDQMVASGKDPGPLAGVPMAIKDMLCTRGLKTTAASRILYNYVPPYSATVVERLEAAGAITLGKANQDEFAMGSSSENSFFGVVKNPWDENYVPGGSSGGTAAAVAAGMSVAGIGTDTGGSIRQPAHFCGVVGVKPTYGRVSRYGIIAFASSLDQAGPMTRTIKDSAEMMEVICGWDKMDATTAKVQVPKWSTQLSSNLKGIKIGLPKEYYSSAFAPDTQKVIDQALAVVREAGAQIVEVSIPLTEFGVPIYYLVAASEASSNLARYDGVRFGHRADFSKKPAEDLAEFYSRSRGEGFGTEVKRRIMLGTYALSSGYYDAYYRKACQVRRLLRDQFKKVFTECDALLTPVASTPAFKIGERIADPLQMYMNDIYTTSTNLVGIPGLSVPGGMSSEGLPIGVQITAAHFCEEKMLNVGFAIEQALGIWKKVPNGL
ncbi:MAG: Asp-tRNA(Asn)/Glu-tRNA(Gln) amidotransferase subunit GatA [Bdellovibrionales bacterium]|nr:Asp-tRNA(Asn)/Glu-tRNA(Gln) amidotransferase subunit GatA [Bdellovibrionales bacterium]